MNALRVPAAVAAAVLTAGVLGSSCYGPAIPDCGTPSLNETAAHGGGPDPCHCDPPPSLNIQACPCLSGTPADVDDYKACLAIYQVETMDGGAD